MKYFLISILALNPMCVPHVSYANFSGLSMTESLVESAESIIDQVLVESKLEEKMASQPREYKKLRSALIRGVLKDNDVLRNIVKVRNDMSVIRTLSSDQQSQEYTFTQDYLKTTAHEFGYELPLHSQ
jgi:hypothetical protein